MTHEPERVDCVIEEMLCSDCQAIASLPGCDCCGPEVDKDDCEAQTRRYAARVRAALSHEREEWMKRISEAIEDTASEYKRSDEAVLRVAAHLADCCRPSDHIGPVPYRADGASGIFTTEFGCCCSMAAALRKAVE